MTGGRKRGHENLCVPAMRLKQKSEKENGKKGERELDWKMRPRRCDAEGKGKARGKRGYVSLSLLEKEKGERYSARCPQEKGRHLYELAEWRKTPTGVE